MTVAQQAQGIDNLFAAFFGFLQRKTDFFNAATPDQSKEAVMKSYEHFLDISMKKKDAEKKRREAIDVERKAKLESQTKLEEQKLKELEAKKSNEAAAKIASAQKKETPKIQEITSDDEEDNIPGEPKTEHIVADDEDEAPPLPGNGGKTDKYVWTQTLSQLEVNISSPLKIASRDVKVNFFNSKLKVLIKGEVVVDGNLFAKVKPDDCMWTLVDGNQLVITLEKLNGMEWWDCVCDGDEKINTRRIVPENSKMGDLDSETRATVDKMLFDQQQKQRGLPSSDQLKQHNIFEKFKKSHPELDFSNAKINYGGGMDSGFSM